MSDDLVLELAKLYRAVEDKIRREQKGELFEPPTPTKGTENDKSQTAAIGLRR